MPQKPLNYNSIDVPSPNLRYRGYLMNGTFVRAHVWHMCIKDILFEKLKHPTNMFACHLSLPICSYKFKGSNHHKPIVFLLLQFNTMAHLYLFASCLPHSSKKYPRFSLAHAQFLPHAFDFCVCVCVYVSVSHSLSPQRNNSVGNHGCSGHSPGNERHFYSGGSGCAREGISPKPLRTYSGLMWFPGSTGGLHRPLILMAKTTSLDRLERRSSGMSVL